MKILSLPNQFLGLFGLRLMRVNAVNANNASYDEGFYDILEQCKPYTMTGKKRMYALYKSVEYIIKNDIPGDFVECGVWRGGSAMVMAMTLKKFSATDREIYLFDTFEGMTPPSEKDEDISSVKAIQLLNQEKLDRTQSASAMSSIWCYANIEDVKSNMAKTLYPSEKIHYVKGMVETELPNFQYIMGVGGKFALVRLDTDWYESTKTELEILYPMLAAKGILILDDYGHWKGAKEAVDEYISKYKLPLFLNRIDYSGRLIVKPCE